MFGVSIGAIISYFLAIGMSPSEIVSEVIRYQTDIKNVFNLDKLDITSILRGKGGGGVNIHEVGNIIEEMTIQKIGKTLTLKELYDDYNKILIILSYNYTDKILEEFSYLNHPDLDIIEVLKMTSNIPVFI